MHLDHQLPFGLCEPCLVGTPGDGDELKAGAGAHLLAHLDTSKAVRVLKQTDQWSQKSVVHMLLPNGHNSMAMVTAKFWIFRRSLFGTPSSCSLPFGSLQGPGGIRQGS